MPYYIGYFGSAEISFEVVDPRFNLHSSLIGEDYERKKHLVVYNLTVDKLRGVGFQLPVTIYDPIDDMCYMGELNITLYE
jgi:hypothetical protein